MAADAKTLYGATLDDIVENLALKPSAATTERFQPMFTSLLTKLKTHRVSGTISAAPVKSPTPLSLRLPFEKLATSTTSAQSVCWRAAVTVGVAAMHEEVDLARDAEQRPLALSSSPPKAHQAERSLLLTIILSVNLVIHMDILLVTVRTASQTPLLLRRSVTPHRPRRTKRKRVSLKKLTSSTRRLDDCAF